MAVVESALGAASRVGTYFSIVSFVPAAVSVAVLTPLVLARPWTGNPHWSLVVRELADPSFTQLALLFALIMLFALASHPLQYSLIQLMEGYWGTGRLSLSLARVRIRHHLDALSSLQTLEQDAADLAEKVRSRTQTPQADIDPRWALSESIRLQRRYPASRDHIMPTLLGNMLRRYELQAGHPYGLNIITVAPHLLLVAGQSEVAYVHDQRTQLDLATRLSASCLLLSGLSAILLAPCGWWLLLASVPYILAQMFYRGACTVAQEYGVALQTLIDLNRSQLYARLSVPAPGTLEEERHQNEALGRVLDLRTQEQLPLVKPRSSTESSV